MSRMKKVFVAMSGGVDSSVAALLLKKAGYDCVGVFMKCWTSSSTRINAGLNADSRGNECGWEKEAEDARRVAEHIGIPFYVFDFEEEYKKRVVEYMVEGYRAGITPNPDVMCNREIKFGLFLERALALGADYVATGHYVRLRNIPISSRTLDKIGAKNIRKYEKETKPISYIRKKFVFRSLWQAKDASKDQSYFLWTLTQEQLKHCLFPIGDYLKSEVRVMARRAGLPTAEKKDSQGICFLGNVLLIDFLKQYLPEREGAVVTVGGKKIGEHEGAHFYTIGQRHLKISKFKSQSSKGESQKPLYVAEKDVIHNTLVVAEGSENPALYKKEIIISDAHFINPTHNLVMCGVNPKNYFLIRANKKVVPMKVLARVRYRQPLFEATLIYADGGRINADDNPYKSVPKSSSIRVVFKNPQKFVAPGQSAVFYRESDNPEPAEGLEMLGGGVIV